MKMLVGVDGVYSSLKNRTGLVIERDDGWLVRSMYQPPVDKMQYMYSILPYDLDVAGQKYEDIDSIRKSLNTTFWMNLANCHQIRIKASMTLLLFL